MTARRKLIAAALSLALPLGAFAQATPAPAAEPPATPPAPAAEAPAPPPAKPAAEKAPLVQVYGTFNVNLQYTEEAHATNPVGNVKGRFAVSIDSTNVGVRGTADLIGGLKGVYQCETQASIDGEDLRSLCNRNSRLGLQSDFGTLFYGNWDSPFKAMAYGTKADDPFLNTDVFGFNGIMGSPGYGARSSAWVSAAPTFTAAAGATPASVTPVTTVSFDQRVANSVTYWTPKWNGLSAKFQWGVNEFQSAKFAGAPQFGSGLISPTLASGVINYDQGPLSVAVSGEYHEDVYGLRIINAANNSLNSSKDYAWRVAAGYDFSLGESVLNVNAMADQLFYSQSNAGTGTATAAAFKDYNRVAYQVGAKWRTGNHELRARYNQALDPSITISSDARPGQALASNAKDELGAKSFAAGYAYYLAKSTQVYLFYTEIQNDARARYTFPVSGAAAVVAANTAAGSTLRAGGLGMRLAF
jgi:predicted porin